ncbi:MAG: hypothetical protein JXB18_07400 [Sedimentisphaerales bacterium]|nr:hypothetical protein [Sedimentisphaerales bacterium]
MMKENEQLCREASTYYYDALSGRHSDIPSAIGAHISECAVCQSELRRLDACLHEQDDLKVIPLKLQQMMLHHRLLNEWLCCEDVRPFLPVLGLAGQAIELQTPIMLHLDHCERCRSQLEMLVAMRLTAEQTEQAVLQMTGQPLTEALPQDIINTLEQIRTSDQSGIYTRAALDSGGQIQVEVKQLSAVRDAHQSMPQGKQISRRVWIRAGLAASILMVLSVCFLSIPSAEGIALRQVYQAVEQLMNCRIQIFVPEQSQPVQTILISRELQIQMYQNPENATLWDLDNKTMLHSDSVSKEPVRQTAIPVLQASQKGFGLMPFNSIRELPAAYSWIQVEGLAQTRPGQQVYDLQWGQPGASAVQIARRWRGFLNASTMLPERIEWWEQLPGQKEQLMMQMVVDYPDAATLTDEIHKVFPQHKDSE